MTRDEAIKAMREGKICYHESNTATIQYAICPKSGCFYSKTWKQEHFTILYYPALFSEDFDEGWEIMKQKVTKTLWLGVARYSNGEYSFSRYDSKENGDTHNKQTETYIGTFPFEIEVEE